MKKILVLILFILISDSVYSYQKMTDAQLKSIINSPSRIVNDLSGTWQVEYDGESYSRFVPYSDLSSDQIIITKNVIIPNEAKEAYTWHLYFLGIENQVEVYWNEQFIGRYFDAVIPFELKIPDNLILRKGNKIKLIISKYDGIRDKIQSTHLFAKKNFIGPIREILLVGKPQIWISDIQPKVQFSNNYSNAYLNVGFTISSSNIRNLINNLIQRDSLNVGFSNKLSVNYQVILIDRQSGAQVASSDILSTSIESERSEIMLSKLSLSYPKMWSPNTPFIYDIKVKLTKNDKLIDEINQEFGFKDIKLIRSSNRSTILLNGEELKIKGISYIEDYEKSGQSISANRLKEDIESMKFNTAVAAFMEFTNTLSAAGGEMSQTDWEKFLIILAPFAPHITEELWAGLGKPFSIHNQTWPQFDKNMLSCEKVAVAVQVNGRTRGIVEVAKDSSREKLSETARTVVAQYLKSKKVAKEIVIPGKVVNFVTK